MATVFLAPTLQPEQQSPQSVQAGCATPAGLTISSKLTTTGAATGGTPKAALAASSARYFVSDEAFAVTRGPEHRGGPREAKFEQPVAAHLPGPSGIGEDARIGLQRHAGIDQRAAAKPAADQHMNVGAEPEIEQPRARAGPQLAAVQLKLAADLGKAAWEFAGQELLALLDDADALARARKPRGGDAAAIAGADDDHVIGALEAARGGGEALLHRPSIAQMPAPRPSAYRRRFPASIHFTVAREPLCRCPALHIVCENSDSGENSMMAKSICAALTGALLALLVLACGSHEARAGGDQDGHLRGRLLLVRGGRLRQGRRRHRNGLGLCRRHQAQPNLRRSRGLPGGGQGRPTTPPR